MRTRQENERLLSDAWVLARHAARSGKLSPNSQVFELIADVERADATPDTGRITRLYREVDALAKAVEPDTLDLLRRRGPLADRLRRAVASVAPFVIGLLTLLLTIYLAFQSSQLHQAATAIREYEEWVAQQPKEKLYSAWKMYRYERVLTIKTPPLAPLDAYQRLVEEAQRLATKGDAIKLLLQESANLLVFPGFIERLLPQSWRSFVAGVNVGEINKYTVRVDLPQSPAAPALPDCTKEQLRSASDVMTPGAGKVSVKGSDERIDSFSDSFSCFLIQLKISHEQVSYPQWGSIYQTKAKINLLVAWLLPGLYGLLGSCVFVMRELVLEGRGSVRADTPVLSSLSLLLRISMGGLAGIIVGWFSVPAPVSHADVVAPISSIPFGIDSSS